MSISTYSTSWGTSAGMAEKETRSALALDAAVVGYSFPPRARRSRWPEPRRMDAAAQLSVERSERRRDTGKPACETWTQWYTAGQRTIDSDRDSAESGTVTVTGTRDQPEP
jgi:hypothetical protein